jgi:hypothetical protein
MIGDTTEFGPVDLLGALAVNALTTNMACKNPAFRVGIKKKGTEDIPPFADYRFLGGVAAAVGGQFLNDARMQRVGHDLACGLLGSFVATETCRKAAQKVVDAGGAQSFYTSAGPALSEPAPAAPAAATAEASANYVYGW